MPRTPAALPPWLAWPLLPLVVAGFAALWVLASLYSDRQCSFMAVVGAVDVLWVLGLQPTLRPLARGIVATIATVALIVFANWGIVGIHVGAPLGNGPFAAIAKLGPHHAWTLTRLANSVQDAGWLVLALAVSALWPWLSARRPAPSAH